jgi:hypothetical protein
VRDRKALWSAVAHRVGWKPTGTSATIRDYDAPTMPFRYFVVRSALVGPSEHNWSAGPYPVSRGVLSPTVVHFNRMRSEADEALGVAVASKHDGELVIRSTADLGRYVTLCVESFDVSYRARGTEHAVMRRQYPIYVADTREARRGSAVLLTKTLTEYQDLRDICFPADGTMHPVILSSGKGSLLLLDAMRVVPLDVGIEQAGHTNPNYRFVTLDFIEVDPTTPLVARSGDNDDLTLAPRANFAITDTTPRRNGVVTLTDTSTGQYDSWEWTIERTGPWKDTKFYGPGPYRVKWGDRGTRSIKLRVYGAGTGASTITKRVRVW